jgi:hypothetical protein
MFVFEFDMSLNLLAQALPKKSLKGSVFIVALVSSLGLQTFVNAQTVTGPGVRLDGLVISTAGFGDLKIGMSQEEAQKALGENLRRVTANPDANCFFTPASNERLVLRIKAGKLVSVDTSSAQVGQTRSGIRVGDAADKVRSTYNKEPSYKETKSPFDQRNVTVVGGGANQVALAMSDGKVDLIRVGLAKELWGRCEATQ